MTFKRIAAVTLGAVLLAGCLQEKRDDVAPQVVETYPLADAERVNRFAPIRLRLSEPPAPSSVSSDTVRVQRFRDAYEPSLDAVVEGSEIVITTELYLGSTYTVTVDGVTDAAGNPLGVVEWTFHTRLNPLLQRTQFTAGNVTGYIAYRDLDASGNPTSIESYGDPGNDGLWFTADDDSSAYYTQSFNDRWLLEEQYNYGTGVDGIPHTVDDVTSRREHTQWDGGFRTQSTTYDGAGVDGTWGTADDDVQQYRLYNYVDGLYAGAVVYDGAGPDGVFFTADDDVASWSDLYRAPDGSMTRSSSFNGPGVDGEWFTLDDVGTVFTQEYDAEGRTQIQYFYADFGVDGEWYTADDTLSEYRVFEWEGDDLEQTIFYDAGGVIERIYAYLERDQYLQQVRTANFDTPGGDGTWGTADDTINATDIFGYDADGNRTTWRDYSDPGPNGTWFDADDVYGVEGLYEPSL